MNLMEVQDDLNKLPPIPRSIEYLTAAAQGGNPEVPPFMALARISEINKQMQSAQQVQPPAEPLNQSLPKQAMQNMGIGALQQGQQQQGMQQMAQQAGAAQRAVPPGIPQPVRQQQPMPQQQMAPRPMPQQGAQPVRMAADGGLMSIPVDPSMFEYGSGGVVAFNGEDDEQVVEEDAEEGDAEAGESARVSYDAVAELRKLQPQIAAQMKQSVRPVRTRAEIERALTKDYGVDTGPVGTKYLEGLASLKDAKAAERAQQQANIDERKKFATSRALLDYSDATRGQTGLGGIGALARSSMGSAEKFMGEESELRQSGVKVDELLNEAQYKVQALRQAQKDGDIKAEQKADVDLAKIAKDLGVSKNTLIGRALTGNLNVIGKQISADAQIQAAKERAKGKGAGAGAKKPTDLGTSYEIELAALIAEGEPDDATTRKRAMNLAQDRLSKSAGTGRVEVSKVEKANQEFLERYYTPEYSDLRKMRKKNPTEYAAGIAKLKNQIKNEFGITPTVMSGGNAPAPAETPAAAPAKSALPPGTTTGKLVPGKGTEVFKDGKLIGYAN
jgi:hypothetical protein